MRAKAIALVISCLSFVTSLSAGTLAVDVLSGTAGLGGGITGGFEFEVTATNGIFVDGLGYWDDQANGFFLNQTFPVGLWEPTSGTLLGSTVISSASTLTTSAHTEGDWRVNAVPPIFLAPGIYRLGGLLPDLGANATISGIATTQVASGIRIIRYLRHIDGATLIMPDLGPPYPEATFLNSTFTFAPGTTNGTNFFYFTSAPGSWIGLGQTLTLSTNLSASRSGSLLSFSCAGYQLQIIGAGSSLPVVGYYPGATRWPFNGSGVGMAFTAPGRANNTLSGWFHVLQADFQTNGQIAAFAVDFVQYDETRVTNWNRGSIRFNSTVPTPGPLPRMQVSKLARTNGVAQFTLAGPAETPCIIQTSSNLATWIPLLTNTISPVGLVQISDPAAVSQTARFYRAVSTSGGGGGGGGGNDHFANRIQISSAGGAVTGTNATATKEPGEPNHGNVAGGKSLWWSWTAPGSGLVSISLDGSSYDTTLGVYTGTAVNSLTSIAQDDDNGAGSASRVIFNAVGGTTYQIAVDGFGGDSGTILLRVKTGLLNDDFVDRLQLIGTSDIVIGSNVGADWENLEPYHWQTTGSQSVWWRWQAPLSGVVTISTAGSNFDTILAAYTGSSMATLSLVANNDDNGASFTSQISFFANAGTIYQIAVDGYDLFAGSIRLSVQQ